MDKLCLIYNFAPHYREAIFRAIDQIYDCDWYFGQSKLDIKEMDTSILKNVKRYNTLGNPEKICLKTKLLSLLFTKEYHTYFMLVEVRSITDWLFFLIAVLFFKHKKIYLWTHGWYGKESGIYAKMKLWLYKNVTGTFVYADYAKRLLVREGIPENKLYVIHNSLRYDEQLLIRANLMTSDIYTKHFANNNPIIIFIGRLTKVKRLDLLLDAIVILNKRGKYYNLVFIGDGIEHETLSGKVLNCGIGDQVWFYGASYDERENANLIFNADLCVAPGNVGLTAMHTMVFGTPVISHNDFKWQMPEFEAIKPGLTGDFFERDNVESLVSVIQNWFSTKANKREEVRQACYNEIDTNWNPHYQMEVIKKNLQVI